MTEAEGHLPEIGTRIIISDDFLKAFFLESGRNQKPAAAASLQTLNASQCNKVRKKLGSQITCTLHI